MLKLRGEKMKMFKKNKKSGFTLMEMLVVITIISILAAAMVMGITIRLVRANSGRRKLSSSLRSSSSE